jgi:predicted MFS family arabinose efflux permease
VTEGEGALPGPAPRSVASRPSPWRDLKEGLVYVWSTPRLQAGMWLAFLVNLTAFPLSGQLLPYVARDVYGLDKTGLGLLAASFAFGAMLGSISVSLSSGSLRPARVMIKAAIVWYLLLLVYAQTRIAWAGMLALLCAGFAQSFSMVPLAVMLLRTSEDRYRGRVMGVRMLAIYSLPIGLLAAGYLIGAHGFGVTATLYAGLGLLLTLAIGLKWRRDIWPDNAVGNGR